jgi:type II secretory pathway pseudopilin PulG
VDGRAVAVSLRLPRLQNTTTVTDKDGRPSQPFQRYWQSFAEQIENAINIIVQITDKQDEFDQALEQAKQATQDAQDAAEEAKQAAAAQKRESALQASYIDPASVLSADTTTITIAPHTRRYADGTSAAVNGGAIAATDPGDTDYVFYVDPDREGGVVTYEVGTTPPVQTGDTHVVGAIIIPATGTADGGEGPRPPGYVAPKVAEFLNNDPA